MRRGEAADGAAQRLQRLRRGLFGQAPLRYGTYSLDRPGESGPGAGLKVVPADRVKAARATG